MGQKMLPNKHFSAITDAFSSLGDLDNNIGSWLVCICRVMDAHERLLSMKGVQELHERLAECNSRFLSV